MKISEMPIYERPREKATRYGIESLSDSELLSILLGNGSKGNNALDLAHSILARFESLEKLSNASISELQKIKGIGKIKALEIKACLELAKRFEQENIKPGTLVNRTRQVYYYYNAKLKGLKKETMFVRPEIMEANKLSVPTCVRKMRKIAEKENGDVINRIYFVIEPCHDTEAPEIRAIRTCSWYKTTLKGFGCDRNYKEKIEDNQEVILVASTWANSGRFGHTCRLIFTGPNYEIKSEGIA